MMMGAADSFFQKMAILNPDGENPEGIMLVVRER